MQKMQGRKGKLIFGTASMLFLISGCCGLIYEVIWFKRFSHVWGSSTLAMAAVVASFLFGLGLGAHIIGRFTDRSKMPLFWYGFCQIVIGVLAFLIPYEIPILMKLSAAFYPFLQNHTVTYYVVRFVLTFLVLGPPCILMGGTLPLLVKHFTPPGSPLKAVTGWLYAINTIGAALGCYIAGFHLLPSMGLYWSNILAILLSVGVGIVALAIGKQKLVAAEESAEPEPTVAAGEPAGSIRNLYIAVTITGFASLVLQMVWVRQLSVILGGSTYAFSAVLFIFLVGIGLGSFIFHFWLRKYSNLTLAPNFIIAAIVITTGIGYSLVLPVTYIIGTVRPLRASQIANGIVCISAGSALELLPALGMGALFPLFVHLTRMKAENAGRAVGNIYAWNTLGCIIGASITSAVLIPAIGISRTIALALFLYLAAMVIQAPSKDKRNLATLMICAVIGFGGIFLATKPQNPLLTNFGMYLYGYQPPQQLLSASKVLDYKEGPSCNVMVIETQSGPEKSRNLRVNGKVDASDIGDMANQLGCAYFPRFLVPTAQKVCVIGFGSGTTAGASLLFGDTEVVCCEIEPAVFDASKYFHHVNHKPEESDNFIMVVDDGRNYLQGTKDKFDIIISEPSNPWIAGISSLFTKEFYEATKEKLTDSGILAQWIQLYSFSPSEYAMVVNTIQQIFDYTALVLVSEGDTLLLASSSQLQINSELIHRAQEIIDGQKAVTADLEKYYGTSDAASLLLGHMLLDRQDLSQFALQHGHNMVNTDTNMQLEYDAPLRLFSIMNSRENIVSAFLKKFDTQRLQSNFTQLQCSDKQSEVLYQLIKKFITINLQQTALEIAKIGRELKSSEQNFAVIEKLLRETESTEVDVSSKHHITEDFAEHLNQIGVVLWRSKKYDKAVAAFEEVVSVHPDSVTAWANLAVNYKELKKEEKAKQALEKAIALDPLNNVTRSAKVAFESKSDSSIDKENTEHELPAGTVMSEGAIDSSPVSTTSSQ